MTRAKTKSSRYSLVTPRRLGALGLAFSLLASICHPVIALDRDSKKNLQKLELKFFEHKYKKESDEKRIERIEKLVFGESKTGSEDERIAALVDTVPELKNASSKQSNSSNAASSTNSSASQSSPQSTQDDTPPDPSVDYPRVDAIEQTMLGKSFKNESLGKRLDQLEIKAFKKSSNDPDLSKRVDHLEKYVRKHYHKSVSQMVDPRNSVNYSSPMASSNSAYRAPAYTSSGGSGSYGMTPPGNRYYSRSAPSEHPPSLSAPVTVQLTWLENHVYGHSYPQKPLIDRVRALEKTVFPSEPPDTSSSIPMQVKVLVNAVSLMHRSGNQAQGAEPTQTASQTGSSSQFPDWPPKSSSAAYGGYAASNQVGTNYNTGQNYSMSQGQYGAGSQAYQQPQSQYGGSQAYNQSQSQSQAQYKPPHKKHGHPFLKGLAKTLLTVGAVAAGTALGGGYYGGGYGGLGGYGRGGYGYGSGYGGGYGGYGGRGLYY